MPPIPVVFEPWRSSPPSPFRGSCCFACRARLRSRRRPPDHSSSARLQGFSLGGEKDADDRAVPGTAPEFELSAMRFDQAFGDRQAEAGAAVVARGRRFGLAEWLQSALLFFLVHADPEILEL